MNGLSLDGFVDPMLVALGFAVGTLVGLTGVGGGSLLTPLLILLAGVRPSMAVGTDLAFAAITKAVGAWQHRRGGTIDWRLTFQLALGSVPGAIIGSVLVSQLERIDESAAQTILSHVLGAMLLIAAAAGILRAVGVTWGVAQDRQPSLTASIALGLVIGFLVGLTSIGAGSLLMAAFALLYAIPAARAVGTDVVHGAILAAVAAVAHGLSGRIDTQMLTSLLAGSLPGVLLGSFLCPRLPSMPVRLAVASVLAYSGVRLF